MDSIHKPATLLPHPIEVKLVTSELFEAYLACPTKCYLLSIGEVAPGNDYTNWNDTWHKTYCLAGLQRLMKDHPQAIDESVQPTGNWKGSRWDFSINQILRTQNCEAHLHAVQRIARDGTNQLSQFIPIRGICSHEQIISLGQDARRF